MDSGNASNTLDVLTFRIEGQLYGLSVKEVIAVLPAAAVYAIPVQVSTIHGLINLHGEIIPVINMRKCLGLPLKEIDISDCFIQVKNAIRQVLIVVDEPGSVIRVDLEDLSGLGIIVDQGIRKTGETNYVENATILRTVSGLIMILNVNNLISGDLEAEVQQLLNSASVDTDSYSEQ